MALGCPPLPYLLLQLRGPLPDPFFQLTGKVFQRIFRLLPFFKFLLQCGGAVPDNLVKRIIPVDDQHQERSERNRHRADDKSSGWLPALALDKYPALDSLSPLLLADGRQPLVEDSLQFRPVFPDPDSPAVVEFGSARHLQVGDSCFLKIEGGVGHVFHIGVDHAE